MRIGFMLGDRSDAVSGAALYNRKLADYLRQCGDTVDLIPLSRRAYAVRLAENLSNCLPARLAAAQWDVLLQDEGCHPALLRLNRRWRGHRPFPIVAVAQRLRSAEPYAPGEQDFYRAIERRYLASVDGFICHSATTQSAISQLLDRPELARSIIAAPGGDRFDQRVTPDIIHQRAQEPGPLRLVFVGDVVKRKGLPILLEALLKLPPGTCQLVIIGNTELDALYMRVVYHLFAVTDLSGVSLAGVVSDAELSAILSRSHAVVVPAEYSGSGTIYREGLGFGLPAIGTTSGVARELISDDVNGYLVPPHDPAALAHRLASLATDRTKLIALSLAARDQFLAQPGWLESVQRVRQTLLGWAGFTSG